MSWRRGERPSRRHWSKVRLVVLDRDGWACVRCQKKGRLEVDHRVPMEAGGSVYAFENCQTLCVSYHREKSRGERRRRKPDPEVAKWQRYLRNHHM